MTRTRAESDDGFSLIELLVVCLIVGILAAIALPSFLGQRSKGQDAAAKSDVRSLVTQMESCYTNRDKYDPCPDANTGIPLGSNPGQVEVSASGDTYTLVAHSRSGNTFTVERKADGSLERTCDGSAAPQGGCEGTTW